MESGVFDKANFRIAGDCGLLVEYGNTIDPAVNQKVRSMAIVLKAHMPDGVIEIIPTYRSILIYYNPSKTTPSVLEPTLTDLESSLSDITIPPPKVVEIPVCYGGEYGPDIDHVAKRNSLTVQEVIRLHAEPVAVVARAPIWCLSTGTLMRTSDSATSSWTLASLRRVAPGISIRP